MHGMQEVSGSIPLTSTKRIKDLAANPAARNLKKAATGTPLAATEKRVIKRIAKRRVPPAIHGVAAIRAVAATGQGGQGVAAAGIVGLNCIVSISPGGRGRIYAAHTTNHPWIGRTFQLADSNKPNREDLMSLEIERARQDVGAGASPTRIWSALKTYAGAQNSCIVALTSSGLRWITTHGDVRYLTMGLLKKRLGRKKTGL